VVETWHAIALDRNIREERQYPRVTGAQNNMVDVVNLRPIFEDDSPPSIGTFNSLDNWPRLDVRVLERCLAEIGVPSPPHRGIHRVLGDVDEVTHDVHP